jgi:hypothetical protein
MLASFVLALCLLIYIQDQIKMRGGFNKDLLMTAKKTGKKSSQRYHILVLCRPSIILRLNLLHWNMVASSGVGDKLP